MALVDLTAVPHPATSIIVTAYQQPSALDAVLRALAELRDPVPEIVVADDGSGPNVEAVVDRWRGRFPLKHVWQPDDGFRKARVANLGANASTGDFLIFLDGDCLPRTNFLGAIRRAWRPGWFLTTKRVMLGEDFSRLALERGTPIWRWSALEWLLRAPNEIGRLGYLLPLRDRRRPWRSATPEFVPPYRAYCMLALTREDFVRVNGYDATCTRKFDGEDQDLAIRLRRSGLKCGWPGPKATVVHLWHPERPDRGDTRDRVFLQTQASDHTEAAMGLRELASEAVHR